MKRGDGDTYSAAGRGEPWNNSFTTSTNSPPQNISKRSFRLAHQTLCINHIDFEQRLLIGFTQLIIWPTSNSLRRFHVNCRQCRIHRILLEAADAESAGLDDTSGSRDPIWSSQLLKQIPPPTDLPILYTDPSSEICKRDSKLRTLDSFQRKHAAVAALTDPDEDAGEVTIRLPPDFWPLVSQRSPLRVTFEFSLNKPKSGFYFVVPEGEGSLVERGVHAFTSFAPNSSRLWFPSIDCSEPCTWKIEVTVFEDLVAVASGELIDAPYYTEDLTHKTYHFYVAQPVAAPYIGLAVGAFEILPDPRLPNGATHFCPTGLFTLLRHTISPLSEILDYYESILASQFPFTTIKTVFVDCAFSEFQAFASLIIFSVDLLHSPRIIDQAIETRKIISLAVASQFFGCFLTMHTWHDAWLPFGMAGYLSGLYQKRVFGNNEYRKIILEEMNHVINFENTKYGIVLDPSKVSSKSTHFDLSSPHLISPDYLTAYVKKAHLIIRMLELRLGQPVLLQVLNKLLVLARLSTKSIIPTEQADQDISSLTPSESFTDNEIRRSSVLTNQIKSTIPPLMSEEHRANMVLSTVSFRRIISMVTGQDIQNFLDQWACRAGHVRLFAKFHFNRKRNVVELEIKQDLQSNGTLNYTGPITAMLQELDGAFMHTFKLEEGRMCRDLPCHSKSRKHRKKKIPLANGDEVDMDLARIDPESPLLWLRLDPDLALIHHIYIDQPDFMWHLMLVHDRDCLGQLEAVNRLKDFASPETRHILGTIILNERIFYRVRMEACYTLCYVVNELNTLNNNQSLNSTNSSTYCLLSIFWQIFSSPASRSLVCQNNFTNLQHYFLQRSMIRALATLRVQQICPHDILIFLNNLIRHNDNSRNIYSDCYYLADLIKSIKDTLTPAIIVRGVMSASNLPFEAHIVVEEISHLLNLETEKPSYKGIITIVCLFGIRKLQKLGFLPIDSSLFYHYTSSYFYRDIRLAAIEVIIDFIRGERDQNVLDWLFTNIIECENSNDASNSYIRFETIQILLRIPPFQYGETGSRLDTPELVERLWNLLNYGCNGDSRLRCAVADLYYTLYGTRRPTCLPLPEGVLLVKVKEGRSVLNLSETGGKSYKSDLNDLTDKYKQDGRNSYIKSNIMTTNSTTNMNIADYEELDESYSEYDDYNYAQQTHPHYTDSSNYSKHTFGEYSHKDLINDTSMESKHKSNNSRNPIHLFNNDNTEPSLPKRTERLSDDEDDD